MQLASTRVVIRERPLADVFDLAIRFVFANGRPFALLALVVVAPAIAAAIAIDARSHGLAWLFALCAAPLVAIPFTVLASRLVFEPAVAPSAVALASLRALPRVAVARGLHMLGAAIGTTTFMLPGGWIYAQFCFVGEVVIVERAGPFAAFSRASRVIAGRFGTAMATSLLLVGLHLGAVILADVAGRSAATELLQMSPPASLFREGGSVLALLGYFGVLPLLAVARFFVYLDLRTRLEGWDVQTRFAAIAQRARQDELDAQGPVSSRRAP
jgi:hypothetical protein